MWWRRVRYVLLLLGLCAIATCPIAKRSCTARSRAREADELLSLIGDRVAKVVSATGKVPPVAAGPSPVTSCCQQGGTCKSDPADWSAQGWHDLDFLIEDDFRYTYEYLPDPSGQSATVRAIGDLDCDDERGTYELHLSVSGQGSGVERSWTRTNPLE
jgi:hypothetical protein